MSVTARIVLLINFIVFGFGVFEFINYANARTEKLNTITIKRDLGGSLSDYIMKYVVLAKHGTSVIIDGECDSACTLMVGILDRDKICITEKAQLGFHASGYVDGLGKTQYDADGGRTLSESGTRLMLDFYPRDIRRWIDKNGGLGQDIINLKQPEISKYFEPCK